MACPAGRFCARASMRPRAARPYSPPWMRSLPLNPNSWSPPGSKPRYARSNEDGALITDGENCRSFPSATPDFLSRLVALAKFMRLSLRKAAHVAVVSAAWQETRVRYSRDDKCGVVLPWGLGLVAERIAGRAPAVEHLRVCPSLG